MSNGLRYGVQYQPLSHTIHAGPVRRDAKLDRDVFISHVEVTGFAIGAVALWLITHDDGEPYQITDRHGTTYELTARIVNESEKRFA
jgi:hypothetical protein